MKKILIALSFTLAAISAQATTVSSVRGDLSLSYNDVAVGFVGNNDVTGDIRGFNGQLSATQGTVFNIKYLGKEAGDKNFFLQSGNSIFNTNNAMVGATYQFTVGAGVLDFGFKDQTTGFTATNLGGVGSNINSIFYLLDTSTPGTFRIGFNDNGSRDTDGDDLVIEVSAVSAVPVPAALPLLATAFGAFGIARRRNKAKAA